MGAQEASEPFRLLAPDGSADRRHRGRARGRWPPRPAPLDDPGETPGPRVHRAAAPGRAHRVSGVRGTGGRPGRQRRGPGARRLRVPHVPGAGGGARARRGPGAVPRVPPRDVARRALRPPRNAVRPHLHPGRHADRARGRLRDGPAARRRGRVLGRVLRRRQRERGRLPRGREPRERVPGAGDPVLPEQRLGDQPADRGADARRDLAARRGARLPRRPRRRQRRAGRVPRHARGPRPRARRRRPDADRGPDLPDRRTLHRRRRRRGTGTRPRSTPPARSTRSRGTARGCSRPGTPTRPSCPPARPRPRSA